MKLEVISKHPHEKTHSTPLLFVHGAWHGAWCWENFLSYFAERGYESHAFSLRGHGNSEGKEALRWYSAGEYVADLASVVDSLSMPPLLIGHSMGGYIVQKYLESHHGVPAGALLASLPTSGMMGMLLRMLKRHPASTLKGLLLLTPEYFVSTPTLAKDAFFSDDYPDEKFREYYSHIQNESFRVGLDATFLNLPRPRRVKTPLLVMGVGKDRIFTVSEERKTGRAYHTEAIIYPDMAHDLMPESDWETVANQILVWLNACNL